MRRRLWRNLALLAAVGVLAAIAILEPGRDREAPRRVSDVDPGVVRSLRMTAAGGVTAMLERTADGWRIVDPVELPASRIRVEPLVGILAAPSLGGFRAAGNDLSRFGLDPPLLELHLDALTVLVGDTEPLDGRRYVLFDGEVHLVPDRYFPYLGAEYAPLVDPAPLGPGATPVEIALPDARLRLDDRGWTVDPPREDVSADRPVEIAVSWANAQATAVRPYNPDAAWRETVSVRVEGAAEPIVFDVARSEYEVLLGRPEIGVQYHLVRGAAEPMLHLQR